MLAKGIIAIASPRPLQAEILQGRVVSMLDADERFERAVSQDRRCMLGAVTGAEPSPWLTLERGEDGARMGVFDGFTYVASHLRAQPSRLGEADIDLRTHGNGMFTAASWRDGVLTLATDPVASTPLYVYSAHDVCAAASSIEVLLALLPRRPGLHRGALAELLSAQTLFGDDSLLTGVRKMPGAALLQWSAAGMGDAGTGARVSRWWTPRIGSPRDSDRHSGGWDGGSALRDGSSASRDVRDRLGDAVDAFARAVRRTMAQGTDGRHAALTGGIDSRTVWAVLLHDGSSCTAVTHAAAEGTDVRIARRIAADLGIAQRVAHIGDAFLADAARDLDRLVEAGNSLCCGDLLHLPYIYRVHAAYTRSIIDGVNTFLERGFALRRAAAGAHSRDELTRLLWPQLRRDGLLALLPEEERQRTEDLAFERFARLVPDPSDFPSPGAAADTLYLRQLLAHHATDAAAVQNHAVRFLTPYYDLDYLEAVARIPEQQRSAEWLQREILRRHAPELEQYPRSYADVRTLAVRWRPLALLPAAWERKVLPHLPGGFHRHLSLRRPSTLHAEWFAGPLQPLFAGVLDAHGPFSAHALKKFLARMHSGAATDTATAGWLLVLTHPGSLLRRFG